MGMPRDTGGVSIVAARAAPPQLARVWGCVGKTHGSSGLQARLIAPCAWLSGAMELTEVRLLAAQSPLAPGDGLARLEAGDARDIMEEIDPLRERDGRWGGARANASKRLTTHEASRTCPTPPASAWP